MPHPSPRPPQLVDVNARPFPPDCNIEPTSMTVPWRPPQLDCINDVTVSNRHLQGEDVDEIPPVVVDTGCNVAVVVPEWH